MKQQPFLYDFLNGPPFAGAGRAREEGSRAGGRNPNCEASST